MEQAPTQTPHGLLLALLGQEARARFRKSLQPLHLSAQQFMVLAQLEVMGPTSQAAVADALRIDYSNLAAVTAELCGRGVLNRKRDPEDRRRYLLELTEEGSALLADANRLVLEGERDMLAVLDESEQAQLLSLLRRVGDSIDLCPGANSTEACAKSIADEVREGNGEEPAGRPAAQLPSTRP
jgi:DNA-binding MarR family transcriptional regulator